MGITAAVDSRSRVGGGRYAQIGHQGALLGLVAVQGTNRPSGDRLGAPPVERPEHPADQVEPLPAARLRLADHSGPHRAPADQRPVGGEECDRNVAQSSHKALNAHGHVTLNLPTRGRLQVRAAEQVVALGRVENRARVVRARERFEQVQALKNAGKSHTAIGRRLRLAPMTVRKYSRATSVDELVAASPAGWPSTLDGYKPHLHRRWNESCTNILQLHREITELGFRASYGTVYAYLGPFKGKSAPPAVPAPPKVRHVTS